MRDLCVSEREESLGGEKNTHISLKFRDEDKPHEEKIFEERFLFLCPSKGITQSRLQQKYTQFQTLDLGAE